MPLVPRILKPKVRHACGKRRLPRPARRQVKLVVALTFSLVLLAGAFHVCADGVRVRDLTTISGARDNQLVGFGLVAGLPNQGDRDPIYTQQAVANMLQRFGVNVPSTTLSAKNVAVVMVTADIPPFVQPGQRLDVEVASMGDAESLQGGVLLQTPLLGADNKVYAVAQGALTVGGFTAGPGGGGGASVTKNIPTTAQIVGGALVEKAVPTTVVHDDAVELLLRNPDFISASRVAAAVNAQFTNSAIALNSSTVRVELPKDCGPSPVNFIAQLQDIEVNPDVPARIIINERTGTIVATADIQISSCAISQGNITINVASTLNVSQPPPFSNGGKTVVTPSTTTDVTENKSSVVTFPELPTVEKVAAALNTLGATPRDIMAIFVAMQQAGALQAQLIVR
jgi:flagellar P-ring protein FlgI